MRKEKSVSIRFCMLEQQSMRKDPLEKLYSSRMSLFVFSVESSMKYPKIYFSCDIYSVENEQSKLVR